MKWFFDLVRFELSCALTQDLDLDYQASHFLLVKGLSLLFGSPWWMLISGQLLSSPYFGFMKWCPQPSHTHLQSLSFDWITSRLPLFVFELFSASKDPLTSIQAWQREGLLDIRWYLQVWWNRCYPWPLLLLRSTNCSAWKTRTSYCDTLLSQLTLQ